MPKRDASFKGTSRTAIVQSDSMLSWNFSIAA